MTKKIFAFVFAVAVSLLGVTYRWGDSAHAIGTIKAEGGAARHPASLESGKEFYTLIATATVIPPYSGDAKVVLEGEPAMDYRIYSSEPVINLGLHDFPTMKGNVVYGLRPKEGVALWVAMRPPVVDPVCGMAKKDGFLLHSHNGKDYFFCSEQCLDSFKGSPEKFEGMGRGRGKYSLAFYDTKTDKKVLSIPLIFKGKGDKGDAGEHHH